jgi:hypothetical protein
VITKQIENPYIKIALRMTVYGFVLGALAGFLSAFTSLLTVYASNTDFIGLMFAGVSLAVISGGGFGIFIGGFGGILSGIVMMLVTMLFFRNMSHPRAFKGTMGMITAVIMVFVFWMGGINFLVRDSNLVSQLNNEVEWIVGLPWLGVYILSILIAVAASQGAATKYLREIDGRKMKEKTI